jgi:hypothetical protein
MLYRTALELPNLLRLLQSDSRVSCPRTILRNSSPHVIAFSPAPAGLARAGDIVLRRLCCARRAAAPIAPPPGAIRGRIAL